MSARAITYMRLEEIKPAPRNPKNHAQEEIRRSIHHHGLGELPLRDDRTGLLVAGHGRHEQLTAMYKSGENPPDGVKVDSDGAWLVPVITGWASRSDADAEAYLVGSNSLTTLGGWDMPELGKLLKSIDTSGLLDLTGYTGADIDSILQEIQGGNRHPEEQYSQPETGKGSVAIKRNTPNLDMIFSSSNVNACFSSFAYSIKWHPGIISTAASSIKKYREISTPNSPPILFVDNEWHGYDHAQHVAVVADVKPKYATVRDLVTKEQAKELGVEYYTIEQTLDMAEEISAHVENVILIPKYDCLDRLPKQIGKATTVLGCSVGSSYGGTPLPGIAFKGWPVHLLGGSWAKQRSLLQQLGDDVVSLDNNQCLKVAQYGQVWLGDGTTVPLDDFLGSEVTVGHMALACILSLSNMMSEVIAQFGVKKEADSDVTDNLIEKENER